MESFVGVLPVGGRDEVDVLLAILIGYLGFGVDGLTFPSNGGWAAEIFDFDHDHGVVLQWLPQCGMVPSPFES